MDDILEKLTINIDSNYAEFKDKTEFYVDMIEDIKNCVYIKTLKTEVYVSSTTPQYTVPSITNVSLNTLSSNNYSLQDLNGDNREKYSHVLRAQNYEKDNFINKNFNNIPFLDFGNYIYVTLNDFYRIRSVSKTNIRKHDPKTFNSLSSSTNNSYKTWKKVDLLAVETFQITDDPSTIDYSNVNTTNLVHNGLHREENSDITDQTVITNRSALLSVGSTLTFEDDIYNINNWQTFLTDFLSNRFYKDTGTNIYYIINNLDISTQIPINMTVVLPDYVDTISNFIIHNNTFYLDLRYNNDTIDFNTGAHVSGQTLTLNIDTSDLNTIITTYNNISTTNLNTLINKFTDKDEVNLDDVYKNVIDGMTYNGGTPDPLQYYFNYSKGTKLYKTDIYFYKNLGDQTIPNYCKFVPTEEKLGICYRNYKINRHTFENSPILDKSIDYIFKEKQINKDYAFTNYIGSYDNNIEYENTETETETAILNYYDSIYINKTTHDFMGVNDNYITVYKHELSGTSCGPNDTNTKILNPLLPELRKFSVKLWRVDIDGSHVPIEINKNGTEGVIRVVMSFTIYYKRKKVTMV
jgi:hypothetical protein